MAEDECEAEGRRHHEEGLRLAPEAHRAGAEAVVVFVTKPLNAKSGKVLLKYQGLGIVYVTPCSFTQGASSQVLLHTFDQGWHHCYTGPESRVTVY